MVVLSPPGRMSPLTPSRSAGSRTRTPLTPIERSVSRCSRNAPWRARTPILMGARSRAAWWAALPAANGEPLLVRDLLERDTSHRGSKALGDLGDLLGIIEECGGLDDGVRHPGRILRLEDARADEDPLGAKL